MSSYQNIGQMNAQMVTRRGFTNTGGRVIKARDGKMSTGLAFLRGELEKVDEKIRQPLSTKSWTRDLPVKTGGGWVETISAMGIQYGVSACFPV